MLLFRGSNERAPVVEHRDDAGCNDFDVDLCVHALVLLGVWIIIQQQTHASLKLLRLEPERLVNRAQCHDECFQRDERWQGLDDGVVAAEQVFVVVAERQAYFGASSY